jgi:hypothetical protein
MFNDSKYWEGVQDGRIVQIRDSSHLAPQQANEPPGTLSETYHYYPLDEKGNMGEKVAVVHQYTRPDNVIGASGRPDPKMVRYQGKTYRHDRSLD